jgi:hypothetical protein
MTLHPIPLNFLIYEENFIFLLSVYSYAISKRGAKELKWNSNQVDTEKPIYGLFRIHREQFLEKQTENLMKTNFESFRYIHSDENHILYLCPSTPNM